MRFRLGVLLIAAAVPLLAAPKGTLTVNGKKVALTVAHATHVPNPFDKKKTDVLLIFTDKELPEGALFDSFARMGLADKGLSGVTVEISDDRSANSGTLFSPLFKKMTQFSATGNQKVDLTTFTGQRIAGTISVPPDDFFDETFAYDVSFDLPIEEKPSAKPLPGKALPAGGGDPGKAYEAYRKVFAAGDLAALRKALVPEMAKQMDEPDFKEIFPMMQEMQPKKVRINGGSVDGTKATLLVDSLDEANTRGTVTLRLVDGRWLLEKESWRSGDE